MVAEDPSSDTAPGFEEDQNPTRLRSGVQEAEAEEGDRLAALVLNLDGFEGPIDLLLTLARDQKVDLARISILQLAEQYLTFVAKAREYRLELAADYLVMAAWLAYLKSRLLIPEDKSEEEPSGEEMAEALAFQLRRLQAIREAGESLMAQPRLGRDVLSRGAPEDLSAAVRPVYGTTFHELLRAYADIRRRADKPTSLSVEAFDLYSVDDAIRRLSSLLGSFPDWTDLRRFLPKGLRDPLVRRSAIAATFVAGLEMVRDDKALVKQEGGTYAPILFRPAPPGQEAHAGPDLPRVAEG
ncbi:MAG: segregation and condensation protein A, partial [Rhodospirillaceae bacterium]